ncbi:MAG: hypothetical protein MMC33_003114 [Icmadophila ericetorum]|nr:hypothetical protein [Icmadophila ericetorum]
MLKHNIASPVKRPISPVKKVITILKRSTLVSVIPKPLVMHPNSPPPFPVTGILKYNIPAEWNLCLHLTRSLDFTQACRHHRWLLEYLRHSHRKFWEGGNPDPRPERDQMAQIYFNLSTIHTMAGEHNLAKEAIENCVKLESGLSMGWFTFGIASYDTGDFENALLAFNMCIRIQDEINALPLAPYAAEVQEIAVGNEYLQEPLELEGEVKWRLKRTFIEHNMNMTIKMQNKLRTYRSGPIVIEKLTTIPVGILYGIPGLIDFKDLAVNFSILQKEQESRRLRCRRREAESEARKGSDPLDASNAKTTPTDKALPKLPNSPDSRGQSEGMQRPVISICSIDTYTPDDSYYLLPETHTRVSKVASIDELAELSPSVHSESRGSLLSVQDGSSYGLDLQPSTESHNSTGSQYSAVLKQPVTIDELSELLRKDEPSQLLLEPSAAAQIIRDESDKSQLRAKTADKLNSITEDGQGNVDSHEAGQNSMPLPEILTWDQFQEHNEPVPQGAVNDNDGKLLLPMVYNRLGGHLEVKPNLTGPSNSSCRSSTYSIPIAISPSLAAELERDQGHQNVIDSHDIVGDEVSEVSEVSEAALNPSRYEVAISCTPNLNINMDLKLVPSSRRSSTLYETRSSMVSVPFEGIGPVAPSPEAKSRWLSFHLRSDSNESNSSKESNSADHIPSAIGRVPQIKPAFYNTYLQTLRPASRQLTINEDSGLELLAPTVYVRPENCVVKEASEAFTALPRSRQGKAESFDNAMAAVNSRMEKMDKITGRILAKGETVPGIVDEFVGAKEEWIAEQEWTGNETQAEIDSRWEDSDTKKTIDWDRACNALTGTSGSPESYETFTAKLDRAKLNATEADTTNADGKKPKRKNKKRNKRRATPSQEALTDTPEEKAIEAAAPAVTEPASKLEDNLIALREKHDHENKLAKACRNDAQLIDTITSWQIRFFKAQMLLNANAIGFPCIEPSAIFQHPEVTPRDGIVKVMQVCQHRKEYSQILHRNLKVYEAKLKEYEIPLDEEAVFKTEEEVLAEREAKRLAKLKKGSSKKELVEEQRKDGVQKEMPVEKDRKVSVQKKSSLPSRSSSLTTLPTPSPVRSRKIDHGVQAFVEASAKKFPGTTFSATVHPDGSPFAVPVGSNAFDGQLPALPRGSQLIDLQNGWHYHPRPMTQYQASGVQIGNGAPVTPQRGQPAVNNYYHITQHTTYHYYYSSKKCSKNTKSSSRSPPTSIRKASPPSPKGKHSPPTTRDKPSPAPSADIQASLGPKVEDSDSAYGSSPPSPSGAQTHPTAPNQSLYQPTAIGTSPNIRNSLATYNSPPVPQMQTPPPISRRVSPGSTMSWYDKAQMSAEKELEVMDDELSVKLSARKAAQEEEEEERKNSPPAKEKGGGIFGLGRKGSWREKGKKEEKKGGIWTSSSKKK